MYYDLNGVFSEKEQAYLQVCSIHRANKKILDQ